MTDGGFRNEFMTQVGKIGEIIEEQVYGGEPQDIEGAYSADGKYLASGAIDGIIAVFDMEQRKLLHTLEVSLEALFCSNLISTCIEPGACHAYQILGLQSR